MTGIHDSVETYEPKVNMGYENSIPKVDSSFDDITDENGNINIIINSDVIGQTLAKKIYTSWTSALRELYNNEARACRMAKKMGGNPSIVITINPAESSRELSIQGVDSLGITKAMFNKVLRVIGTSGNVDGNEIGQFGMGFISYALLTDALILETWSRESNEHYSMLCDSGLKFKPIPVDKDNDVETMSNYGTKLTMTCNSNVKFNEMIEHIEKLARFSKVPTKIILLDDTERSYYYSGYNKGIIECESFDNGMEYMKSKDKYDRNVNNRSHDSGSKIVLYDEVTIDNDDYCFEGILMVEKSRYGTVDIVESNTDNLLLLGTHIDGHVLTSGFYSTVLNIKNERKYTPVASRDSISEEALESIQKSLKDELIKYFDKYNVNSIEEYNNSLTKPILSSYVMSMLRGYLSETTRDIATTLNSRYGIGNSNYNTLSDILASGGTIVCLKSLRGSLMEALTDHFDSKVQFFRLPSKLSDEQRGHRIDLFKQLGIIMGDDYKKEHKIKEIRDIKQVGGKSVSYIPDRSIVLYNSNRGYKTYDLYGSSSGWRSGSEKFSSTISNVNENIHDKMITVPTKVFNDVLRILNRHRNDWKVMHDMKGISDDVTRFDSLMTSLDDYPFQTNKGIVKGKDLKGEYRVIVMDSHEELIDNVEAKDDVTIIALPHVNDVVTLDWYCFSSKNDERFTLDPDVHGHETDKLILGKDINYRLGSDNVSLETVRIYWITKLLPEQYSDVFVSSMLNEDIPYDVIESTARELYGVLNK